MQRSVRRHEAARVNRALAAETGSLAPSFLHDHLQGGNVPRLHHGIEPDLPRPFRHQHVLVEVSKTARPLDSGDEPGNPARRPRLTGPEVTMEQQGALERIDARYPDAAPVAKRAVASRGVPAGSQGRRTRDPGHDLALVLDRQ